MENRLTRRGLISDDSLMPDHPADIADKPEDVATLRAALLAAEARIAALEQIIHSFQRARFGQSAERIDTAQLALMLGQEGGVANWAIAATLIRTAILNGVDPQAWLTDVLEQMVSGKVNSRNLAALLPWAWRDAKRAKLAA
jgi:hypothetical protein